MRGQTRPKILIVDDDPGQLGALAEVLRPRFEVVALADPVEAENRLDDSDLSVILTDQSMPAISGTDLLHLARKRSAATRLLMTAFQDLEALTRAINDGHIFGFVRKPVNPRELIRLLMDAAENFRLRRELDLERRLLQTLLESSTDSIAFKDQERRFLRSSRTCSEMLGIAGEPTGLLGLREEDVAPGQRAVDAAAIETAVLESGVPSLDRIERIVTSSGDERWQSVSRAPLRAADGTLLGLLEIGRDITERKRLEEQFVHAQRMEAVGRLAGGVAHDFNNLLTAIAGFTELVGLSSELDSEDRDNLGEIVALVDRGAALTRQLLAVSRRQTLRPQRLDACAQLRNVAAMLERLLGEGVHLELSLPPDPLWVEADPPQVDQVLMNLAINARDAMPEGGRLCISAVRAALGTASARRLDLVPGTYVEVAVSDTGHGIPAAALPRIFEPFFTTKAETGTGLGLPTAYGIVRQHGGALEVGSSTSRGTTFRVLLPEREPPAPEVPPVDPHPAPARAPRGASQLILLVEDDGPVRTVLSQQLRSFGYRVVACGTAAEALRSADAAGDPIDLLVTDIGLPDRRGGSLYRELLRQQPGLPVVFVTGYLGDSGTADLPALSPLTHFLSKPFTAARLLDTVASVLGQRAS